MLTLERMKCGCEWERTATVRICRIPIPTAPPLAMSTSMLIWSFVGTPLDAARISEIAKLNDTFTTPNRIFDIRPPARVYMSDAVVAFGRLSAPDS